MVALDLSVVRATTSKRPAMLLSVLMILPSTSMVTRATRVARFSQDEQAGRQGSAVENVVNEHPHHFLRYRVVYAARVLSAVVIRIGGAERDRTVPLARRAGPVALRLAGSKPPRPQEVDGSIHQP